MYLGYLVGSFDGVLFCVSLRVCSFCVVVILNMLSLTWSSRLFNMLNPFSRLPALAKTYTGSKGVQITTIGISPYDVTDAGNHNPQVIANGTDIRNAGNVSEQN